MRELRKVKDLKLLREAKNQSSAAILLIVSLECDVCAFFKPVYKKLQERLKDCCEFYIIEAESTGGRGILSHGFKKEFGCNYRGYPSLFIVTPDDAHEIPYQTVVWNAGLRRFDDKRIAQHVREYLLQRNRR